MWFLPDCALFTLPDFLNKYKEKLNCDGITLCQNNEYGQEVKHYHLHIVPKYQSKISLLDVKEVYEKFGFRVKSIAYSMEI